MKALLKILILNFLISLIFAQGNVITLSKTLYIPGEYFSLMNYTYNLQKLNDYFDVDIDFELTQTAYSDQGNSIYDFFIFNGNSYSSLIQCYYDAISYLSSLYKQFEPCQGGCPFQADAKLFQSSTSFKMINDDTNSVSLIVDNTFYPCKGGAYQSQIYLYQTNTLSIESNFNYDLIIKIVFVVLMQVIIFLFAYIMITINKLNNKKKKIKKLKEDQEDQDVLLFEKSSER